MFYVRYFNKLKYWQAATDLDKICCLALNDWSITDDNGYSFYKTTTKNFLDKSLTNVVIALLCYGNEKWFSSIGLMAFKTDDVDAIGKLIQNKSGRLKTIHCNLINANRIIRNRLEELSFKNRKNSHLYTLEEMATAI